MATRLVNRASVVISALLLVAVVFTAYTAQQAIGSHEPANKAAAAGSDLDEINGEDPILTETFKVSSQEDMIIQVTSECSILTSLITGDDEAVPDGESFSQDSARAFGQVELFVTLDGKRVPVSVDDPAGPNTSGDDPESVGSASDTQEEGEVVFCNRAYQRTVQDDDGGDDEGGTGNSIDTQRDYIRTRTANAFNWLAVDIGFDYDEACADASNPGPSCVYAVSNGNNIIEAVLWAEYEATGVPDDPTTPENEASRTCPIVPGTETTCSEAFVGSRTMILEPIKLSIHEQVERDDLDGGS